MVFVRLKYGNGLTVWSREIAEALSLSESTVRVQIKIAVDRIVAGIRTHYPDLKLVSLLLFLFTARF